MILNICTRQFGLADIQLPVHIQGNVTEFVKSWFYGEVKLRPTVSRPVCLVVGLPSGAHDQIFVFCLTIVGFLTCGALSDKRMGL
jgi:hypothetical protein